MCRRAARQLTGSGKHPLIRPSTDAHPLPPEGGEGWGEGMIMSFQCHTAEWVGGCNHKWLEWH